MFGLLVEYVIKLVSRGADSQAAGGFFLVGEGNVTCALKEDKCATRHDGVKTKDATELLQIKLTCHVQSVAFRHL